MKYKRILLKLSGEALMGKNQYGIAINKLEEYAAEISAVAETGVQVAIVIGGGNIFRGLKGAGQGYDRVQGDYMGMLATVINSLAMQSALENMDVKCQILSGIPIDNICKAMNRRRALDSLAKGKVIIIAGGTGNPYFTTDTAAALRAVEIKADVLLKGTRVDGVYTSDPEKNKNAKMFDKLTFEDAYEKHLNVMDMTAFTLCRENKLPIIVFNMNKKGNLLKAVKGLKTGTIIN
ncbi:MAG: UMP kinase [Bacteroidales bacterium]|jgi:uridylate kinase